MCDAVAHGGLLNGFKGFTPGMHGTSSETPAGVPLEGARPPVGVMVGDPASGVPGENTGGDGNGGVGSVPAPAGAGEEEGGVPPTNPSLDAPPLATGWQCSSWAGLSV